MKIKLSKSNWEKIGKEAGWMKKEAISPLWLALIEAKNYSESKGVDIKTALEVVMKNKGGKIAEDLMELAKNDINTINKLRDMLP
jgi:hypothetical protein